VNEPIRSRRLERCDRCGLATALCLCAELPRVATRTNVVLVMHKNELGRTSNTGRLALAVLERAKLSVRGVLGGSRDEPPPGRRLVLFPAQGARELAARDAADSLTLVVPDGSWKQARRMLSREAWARDAEVVRLPPTSSGRYDLRRQTREGALCTFEAIARALGLLEGGELERELLGVLDAFLVRVRHMRVAGGSL